ncbi:Uncharacterised protein [Yersinia frederiksenii]|nr:Uncharacterised protein [Yersinia frederiksenii]
MTAFRQSIFRRCGGLYLSLRADNIKHLPANLTNQLGFFQAILLFLFIKDRGEGVISMFQLNGSNRSTDKVRTPVYLTIRGSS